MTPIIRNKEDRERVRKWLRAMAKTSGVLSRSVRAVPYYEERLEHAARQHAFLQAADRLTGPTPKARKK